IQASSSVKFGDRLTEEALSLDIFFERGRIVTELRKGQAPASILARSQVVLHYGVYGSYAIFPVDLFALRISTAMIRNTYLINSAVCAGELGDNFRFDSESVFFNLNGLDQRSPEGFVPRFNISQVKISKHVGKQRQKPVAGHVPEEENTMRPPAHEPGAEDYICVA